MPQDMLRIAAGVLGAYLLGAIPFALVVGKTFFGVDVRSEGSGNLGATNVFRVLGARAGVAVFVLDAAKGAAAVALAVVLRPTGMSQNGADLVLILAALGAMLGHSYSPYVRFRGGKGVAVSAGALLVITPLAILILFVTFVVVVVLSRMVSLGSVVVAAAFPPLAFALYGDRPVVVGFAFVAAALVIWRHRSNIGRIRRGEEAKISWSKRGEHAASDEKDGS